MTTTQIQSDDISKSLRVTTYYKKLWSDEWTHAPHWQPIHATNAAAPAYGSASFRLLYGTGKWEDELNLTDGTELETFTYCYVQIRGYYGENEIILWVGIIPIENFRLLGKSDSQATATADQILQAMSLDALLETRLDGGWVQPVGGGGDPVWLDELPTFNQRYEYGGTIIGNRSEDKKDVQREHWTNSIDCHVFSDEGHAWGNYDIAVYLLQNYQDYSGPKFLMKTADEGGEVAEALNQLIGVYDFHSTVTVRQALDILISRSRGFSWRFNIDSDDNVSVVPFTLVDEPITLGNTVIPANPNRTELNLWERAEQTTVDIVQDIRPTYDRIIVRGAKIKACCSLRHADDSLEKAWTDDEEKAFQDAAKNADGYLSLTDEEKGVLNDKYRQTDRFSRVYTTLRVPREWNWTVNNGIIVNWKRKSDGLIYTQEQGNYWNVNKRLLPYLPFIVGVDYSGTNDDEPVDNNAGNSEPEYRKLFAVVENRLADQYRYIEKCEPAPGTVRPLSREMGIKIKFNPQYLLARGNWKKDAEPGKWTIEEMFSYGFSWKKVIATVFIETDQYNQLIVNLNDRENKRTLTIEIPEAELWYVVPGTIVDIDADGKLVEFGCEYPILRDDRDRLRSAMVAAISWYGKQHNKITITIQGIDAAVPLGTIIVGGDVTGIDAADSVVTSMRWLFDGRPPKTIVTTDFAPLNIAGVFSSQRASQAGGGTVATPSGLVSSKKIEQLESKIALLFKEISLHAVRVEPEKLKETYTVREAVAKEDAPSQKVDGENIIVCNMLDDEGRLVEYDDDGEEINVNVYLNLLADDEATVGDCTPDIKKGDPLYVVKLPHWNEEARKSSQRWSCLFWFERDVVCGCTEFTEE